MAIVFNAERLELIESDELTEVQLGSPNLRAPLFAHFRGKSTGIEFIFMVTHLLRGGGDDHDEARRLQQASMLNDWVKAQVLSANFTGDFNADFNCENGDTGDRAPLCDKLIEDNSLQWRKKVASESPDSMFQQITRNCIVSCAETATTPEQTIAMAARTIENDLDIEYLLHE